MIGAHVGIKNTNQYSIVGLDGSYAIGNIPEGEHILLASFIGYVSIEKTFVITSEKETVVMEFTLEPTKKCLKLLL